MNTRSTPWSARFDLDICAANEVETRIAPNAVGVAVIYTVSGTDETTTYFVLESRARGLRELCTKRLETAKIPAGTPLLVAFRATTLADTSQEAVNAECRKQVILAGELRRALRPAMR
jgi:hypothetical protein